MDDPSKLDVDTRRYMGFWPRAAAGLVDVCVMLPVFTLSVWARRWSPLAALVFGILYVLSAAAYRVGFNATRGATPGKSVLRMVITRVDGRRIGLREALLRESLNLVIAAASWIVLSTVLIGADSARYDALGYSRFVLDYGPQWYATFNTMLNVVIVTDVAVLLFNARKRAVRDYIAGTVVVKAQASA